METNHNTRALTMCTLPTTTRFLSCLAVLIVLPLFAEDATPPEDTPQIFVVGSKPDHKYGSHMYEFDGKLLATCLRQNNVRASYLPEWPIDYSKVRGAAAVVFYSRPAGSTLLAPPHQAAYRQLMQSRTGMVAIHWGTGVGYDKVSNPPEHRDLYRSWLGGWFRRPPCDVHTTRTQLYTPDAEHPITRGWKPWRIHDEFYLNPVLHPQAKPLLQVTLDNKDHVVGWTYQRPDAGRSVGITLGHFHHNFARDDFRRMLVNAILWAAGQPVPSEGANVNVSADHLKLPPKPVAAK